MPPDTKKEVDFLQRDKVRKFFRVEAQHRRCDIFVETHRQKKCQPRRGGIFG